MDIIRGLDLHGTPKLRTPQRFRSVHVDAGEILEPALRRAKAFYVGRHRSRVQVVDDPYPGRLVDDQLMRRGEDVVALGRDERLLRLRQQFVDLGIAEMTPIPVGWREAGGVVVSIER